MISEKRIRLADERDGAALLDIYAPYIRNTIITFEYEVPSADEFSERIRAVTQKYPWLVCEIDGKIAGYAYASRFKERAAYQWSVLTSVYVDPSFQRQRVATALYTALFEILRLQGFCNAVAGISVPNPKSDRFHESFGFKLAGYHHHIGYKLGAWHDVKWYELSLADLPAEPAPVKGINEIKDTEAFDKIIEKALKALNTGNAIKLRSYRHDDIGFIVKKHMEVYGSEYGFLPGFLDYVEKYITIFDESRDPEKENIWIVEVYGKPAGSIAAVKYDDSTAQLRWFILDPGVRGRGLGRMLMEKALAFCRERGYRHAFLWTAAMLDAARHLYSDYGFKITETKINREWSAAEITEERWDMDLC